MWSIVVLGLVHPSVRTAYLAHSTDGVMSVRGTRRCLSDLGADVSVKSAIRLRETYGDSVEGMQRMIDESAVASPAKYWIALDPGNTGLRKTRRGWNRFARAGLLSPWRVAHYGFGLASLMMGSIDFVDYVWHGGTMAWHGSEHYVVHASVHLLAAIFSLPRFSYNSSPDGFNLWLKTARDANMWPSALLYAWYTVALSSNFVRADGSIDMVWMQPLTFAVNVALMYGASRAVREGERPSMLFGDRVRNMFQVMTSMTIPVMAETLRCQMIAGTTHDAYVRLLEAYPELFPIYAGSFLGAMFAGNLACALASAEHHGAVTKSQINDLQSRLNLATTLTAFSGFFAVDGLPSDMWELMTTTIVRCLGVA